MHRFKVITKSNANSLSFVYLQNYKNYSNGKVHKLDFVVASYNIINHGEYKSPHRLRNVGFQNLLFNQINLFLAYGTDMNQVITFLR